MLATRTSTAGCVVPAALFAFVLAAFAVAVFGFVAFRPVVALPRVALAFSVAKLAKFAVAAAAANLAGDICFDGDNGFSGEAGRER